MNISRRSFIFLVLLCVFILSGCGKKTYDREAESVTVELTQRQKDLLEKMGLPTEYDQLTYSQKNAIVSTEEMLTYLEESYNETFCYLSYTAAGALEKEHLEAYPAAGSPEDVVTVYRSFENGVYFYEDDYCNLQLSDMYESVVRSFAERFFPQGGLKIFCDIKNSAGEVSAGEVSEKNVIQSVSAATCIFISGDVCTKEQMEEFSGQCAQWLGENSGGKPAQIWLRLTEPDEWEKIERSVYEEKLTEEIYISEKECAVSSSGKIAVY